MTDFATMSSPSTIADPLNRDILRAARDTLRSFSRDPVAILAAATGIGEDVVVSRLRSMVRGGAVRRMRQTIRGETIAPGALVAWRIPPWRLGDAWRFMADRDLFTAHIILRAAEPGAPHPDWSLWSTVKVPPPHSLQRHCDFLRKVFDAEAYAAMSPITVFPVAAENGNENADAGDGFEPRLTSLEKEEWRVLLALRREFTADEIEADLWRGRAIEARTSHERFLEIAEDLARRGIFGRFALDVDQVHDGGSGAITPRTDVMFQWSIAPQQADRAGREIARHRGLEHCSRRTPSPEWPDANLIAVSHGANREALETLKRSIDARLLECGIDITASGAYWAARRHARQSEISSRVYARWSRAMGIG
jgi:DNA-binding Lrp family transcriptional regulator